MPREFWEWYDKQNFELGNKELWEHKDKKVLLLGIMIKFLLDKQVSLNMSRNFISFDDFYSWIDKGVEWNCGD